MSEATNLDPEQVSRARTEAEFLFLRASRDSEARCPSYSDMVAITTRVRELLGSRLPASVDQSLQSALASCHPDQIERRMAVARMIAWVVIVGGGMIAVAGLVNLSAKGLFSVEDVPWYTDIYRSVIGNDYATSIHYEGPITVVLGLGIAGIGVYLMRRKPPLQRKFIIAHDMIRESLSTLERDLCNR